MPIPLLLARSLLTLGAGGFQSPGLKQGAAGTHISSPAAYYFGTVSDLSRLGWLAACTEADFEDHRRRRAFRAWKEAAWEAGLELPWSSMLLWRGDRR